MSMWKATALALLIPVALAAPLAAQERGGPDGPRFVFEDFDLDGDGVVTLEEMIARGEARFAERDADGDGSLSRDELIASGEARVAARVDRLLERADADGDGALSQEELAELRDGRRGPNPERIFNRIDANDDGRITEAEFEEARERLLERRGGGRHHDRG